MNTGNRSSTATQSSGSVSSQHRIKNGSSSGIVMETGHHHETASSGLETDSHRPKPMIGNINSPSVSMASVSSDESASNENSKERASPKNRNTKRTAAPLQLDSNDARYLHCELARLTEVLEKLRRAFQDTSDRRDVTRKITTERLGEMLKILRPVLDRYPVLQTQAVMSCASHLIDTVTTFNNNTYPFDYTNSAAEFYEVVDSLKQALSDSVSECVIVLDQGQTDSSAPAAAESSNSRVAVDRQIVFPTTTHGLGDQLEHHDEFASAAASAAHIYSGDLDFSKDFLFGSSGSRSNKETESVADIGSVDQIDGLLVRHDRGVDLALDRAKLWSKYAKDVLIYVEKRMAIELDWVKNLAKLAQERRPVLKEESYLPFQTMYCMALDVDLEVCSKTQQTCSLLADCKFIEPLKQQRAKHDNMRKSLRDKWNKERKRLQNAVIQLKKAKEMYNQRHQEYERCHEAVRLAEQGNQIGLTGENKLDKRKRYEDEAMAKTNECEIQYRFCVDEANERHRGILHVKTEILRDVRELIVECDRVMKEVTVNYFQHMHALLDSVPTQYLTLCENSRLYEPGHQFLEYVRQMPDSQFLQTSMSDPFSFEPITGEAISSQSDSHYRSSSKQRTKTTSLGSLDSSSTIAGILPLEHDHHRSSAVSGGSNRREAWIPSMGAIDPSDTESVESERSSPSGSPLVGGGNTANAATPAATIEHPVPGQHAVSHRSHPVIYYDDSTDGHPRSDAAAPTMQRGYLSGASSGTASSRSGMPDHVHDPGISVQTASSSSSAAAAAAPTSPTTPPRKLPMSRAANAHRFRKVKTPSKCRDCDTIIMYFNGYECGECGLASHKKCFESLVLMCNHHKIPSRKMQCFGQDLKDYAQMSLIPLIIIRCVEEIDLKGLDLQGIYRVSAAQKRIEKLMTNMEWGAELIDFDAFPPHVIADVLKNFLRQLPEPLLTSHLCPEYIQIADAYSLSILGSGGITGSPSPTTLSSSTTSVTNNSSVSSVNTFKDSPMAPLAVAESSSNSPPQQQQQQQQQNVNNVEEHRAAINKLKELCRKLPKPNFNSVNFLMHHLGRVAAKSENNSMTASNLAIVFAPNLLRSNMEIKDIKDIGAVDGTKNHFRVIELLILHAPLIFGPAEQVSFRKSQVASKNDHYHHHHHHRGPRGQRNTTKHRGSRGGGNGASTGIESSDLISSQTERRSEVPHDDFATLPGLVNSSEEQTGGSTEDIFGASVSEDDDDINFLCDGSSSRGDRKSQMLRMGNSSPPLIIKQSLRNFSGLEGVTPSMLSTQDSLEVAQRTAANLNSTTTNPLSSTQQQQQIASSSLSSAAAASSSVTARRTVHHESNMPIASDVSTAVFHKVTPKPVHAKKHSITDDNDLSNNPEDSLTTETDGFKLPPAPLPPASAAGPKTSSASIRSGSLSEEVIQATTQRRSRGTTSATSLTSQSMPTSTILNLEENRVTIQVPGGHPVSSSTVHHRTTMSHHSTVIKQTSIDKEEE